jgi:hypothetical protein
MTDVTIGQEQVRMNIRNELNKKLEPIRMNLYIKSLKSMQMD